MKLFYINLKRATERRQAMEAAFKDDTLVRVEAVDGEDWTLPGLVHGFPKWNPRCRVDLVKDGILDAASTLPPSHVACNLSHKAALDVFLKTGDEVGVILEDDVEPVEELKGRIVTEAVHIPKGFDVYYLIDPKSVHGNLVVKNSQVQRAMTLAAYAVTRHGAEVLRDAIIPMMYLADGQLPPCCYESMQRWVDRFSMQKFESKVKVKAGAFKVGGLVQHSKLARASQLGH